MIDTEDEILGKAYDSRLMRRFVQYLIPYWPLVFLSLFLIFLRIGTELAGPLLLKGAVDGPISTGDFEGLVPYVGAFFIAVTAMSLFTYLETWITNHVGQKVIRDLRMKLFAQLQRVPVSFYDQNPVGRLVVRTTNDIENLNELFTSGMIALLSDVFLILGILVLLFLLDWQLALITLVTAPIIGFLVWLFRRFARDQYREMRKKIARLNSYLNESIQGMRTILMFHKQDYCQEQFRIRNAEYRDTSIATVRIYSIFFPGVEVLSSVTAALLLWYGGYAILSGTLTFGSFLAFWFCAQKFFQPVRDLSEKYNILQSAMASSERIFKILDTPAAPGLELSKSGEKGLPTISGEITFENVSFRYNEKTPVLENISFTIKPGERVAIVGYTGAGKTTLLNLLLRFYEISEGRILIDGKDLKEFDPRSLRTQTGLVLQDVFLFAGTIAENITLGTSLPKERIQQAIHTVGADHFVNSLPKGLDTLLSERGTSLSVGERQLISFARALAFDPRILLLDEATSSVDRETEKLIQNGLEHLLENRTSLVVAHRLSTIQNMDRILVLHHGRIEEMGTHEELVKKEGLYRDLYKLQFEPSAGEA